MVIRNIVIIYLQFKKQLLPGTNKVPNSTYQISRRYEEGKYMIIRNVVIIYQQFKKQLLPGNNKVP